MPKFKKDWDLLEYTHDTKDSRNNRNKIHKSDSLINNNCKILKSKKEYREKDLNGVPKLSEKIWVERWEHLNINDLVINKKKVDEVTVWLRNQYQNLYDPYRKPVLIIHGPPGCGKSVLVKVICKENGIRVLEWDNKHTAPLPNNTTLDGLQYPLQTSQRDTLKQFMRCASRYKPIMSNHPTALGRNDSNQETGVDNGRSVVLIDVTSSCCRDNGASVGNGPVATILRDLEQIGMNGSGHVIKYPMIFTITDDSQNTSGENECPKLLPPFVLAVKLLPITERNVSKALSQFLRRLVTLPDFVGPNVGVAPSSMSRRKAAPIGGGEEPRDSTTALVNLVGDVARMSGGDLRAALNSLQFYTASAHGPEPTTTCRTSSHPRHGPYSEPVRDFSVDRFRTVGKVLYYNKKIAETRGVSRMESKNSGTDQTIQDHHEILDKMTMGPESYLDFLHHNSPSFFSDVHALSESLHHASSADQLFAAWEYRFNLSSVAVLVATSGYILHQRHQGTLSKWLPLNKPKLVTSLFGLNTKLRQLRESYHKCSSTPINAMAGTGRGDQMATLDVPYLKVLRPFAYRQHIHPNVLPFAGEGSSGDSTVKRSGLVPDHKSTYRPDYQAYPPSKVLLLEDVKNTLVRDDATPNTFDQYDNDVEIDVSDD